MNFSNEYILIITSILFFLSIFASKASGKMGVPALLLFLILGMLSGSEGIGGIHFDNPHIAQFLGTIALTLILFSGGLDTEWHTIRTVLVSGLLLSTLGVLMTAFLLGLIAHFILGFPWLEGLLIGAIVSSTDAPTVFTVFKARSITISKKLKNLLEFESASNDPTAIILTIGVVQVLTNPEASYISLSEMLFSQIALGGLAGFFMGKALPWSLQRLNLEYRGLYPVFTIAGALFTYSATALIGGNGFLAVYITGLLMGNQEFFHKKEIILFHDGLTWLMQIGMFLTLGLLVFPLKLLEVVGPDILVAVSLIIFARPISVFAVTSMSKMKWREQALVSWVGLRGAVPIILATFPLVAEVPNSEEIFNLVFFIVLISMLLQGTSIPWVTRFLKLDKEA